MPTGGKPVRKRCRKIIIFSPAGSGTILPSLRTMIKRLLFPLCLLVAGAVSAQQIWTTPDAEKWLHKGEWKKGLTDVPHASVDPVAFATQYHQKQKGKAQLQSHSDVELLINDRCHLVASFVSSYVAPDLEKSRLLPQDRPPVPTRLVEQAFRPLTRNVRL